MKRILTTLPVLMFLVAAVPVSAQSRDDPDGWDRAANLNGQWYMNGNPDQPCFVRESPDGRATFTNEKGSRARGVVRRNHVSIPDWSPGQGIEGLEGRVRGDRIVWPDGSFWSR